MDLTLIRLIRFGETCLLEEAKNGWFLPYQVIDASTKVIGSLADFIANNTPTPLIKAHLLNTKFLPLINNSYINNPKVHARISGRKVIRKSSNSNNSRKLRDFG